MAKLTVVLHQAGMAAEEVEASSLEDASRKVTEWQDARGLGASGLAQKHGTVRLDGVFHARISYNGRITGTPEARKATVSRMVAEVMAKTGGSKR